jgi:glc operon protein GlcG
VVLLELATMAGLQLSEILTALSQLHADGHGVTPVTIAVCDAAGDLLYLGRADGVPGFSAEFAVGKAYTAARFGNSTAALEAEWEARPVFAHSLLTQGKWFVGRGGVPVRRAGAVAGAVGVSGADAHGEEAVALAMAGYLGDSSAE